MAEIEWTDEAKSWLQPIYDYIARDNEEAAWQVILGIYDRVQVLRQFPECGPATKSIQASTSAYCSTVINISAEVFSVIPEFIG